MDIGNRPCSYLSPKVAGCKRADGERGSFACEEIAPGELIAAWGGKIFTYAELLELPPRLRSLSIQVEEDLFLVTTVEGEGDWVNHSCSPNAGLSGQLSLVAMRTIYPGEEVTFDYAMCDSKPYDEFPCNCGADSCRQRVTGQDWQRPELQRRYRGYFSPYLESRIQRQRAHRNGTG